MIYIGCDPGRFGGFASLDEDGKIIALEPMPQGLGYPEPQFVVELIYLMTFGHKYRFALEQTQTRPEQGIGPMHRYGIGAGVIMGAALAYHPESFCLVRPDIWQKHIWGKFGAHGEDTKKRTDQAMISAYPTESGRWRTKRGMLLDGLSDALGIATYLRDKHK